MSVRLDITAESLRAAGARELHAGDDYDMRFTLKRNGAAVDLTSASIWLTIKDDPRATDAQALLQLTDSAGINIDDAVNGKFLVEWRESDTADLAGLWEYDIQVKLGAGAVITWATGKIELGKNITRSTS